MRWIGGGDLAVDRFFENTVQQDEDVSDELARQLAVAEKVVKKALHCGSRYFVQLPVAKPRKDVVLERRPVREPGFWFEPALRPAHPIVTKLSELDLFRFGVTVISNRLERHTECVLRIVLRSEASLPLLLAIGGAKNNCPAVA